MIGSGMALLLAATALVLVSGNVPDTITLNHLTDYLITHTKPTPDINFNITKLIKDYEDKLDPKDPLLIFKSEIVKKIRKKHPLFMLRPAFLGFHSGSWKVVSDELKKAELTVSDVFPVVFGDLPEGVSAAEIKRSFGIDSDKPLFVVKYGFIRWFGLISTRWHEVQKF